MGRMFGDSRLPPRFWEKVEEANGGCWLWSASKNRLGYGQFRFEGKIRDVHRLVFVKLVGMPDKGIILDHLCRNRACCNPEHLEPVTQRVNCLRGEVGQHNRNKTHCPKGHPYSGDNLVIRDSGRRGCRECRNAYSKKRREDKRK